MRIKESFTLFKRRHPSGLMVYYYRTYTPDGKRTTGHSTGESSKVAAREYCNKLLREGKLITVKGGVPTFEKFAEGWWNMDTCAYLGKLKARRDISQGTARQGESTTRLFLIPAFGKQKLDAITTYQIDTWLTDLPKKGYANNTANNALKFLRIMLSEATLQGKIQFNPCDGVKFLPENKKEIDILTPVEVKKLFPQDWSRVWQNELIYICNKLAACTGMRLGELMGLRGEYLFDGYINVHAQYSRYGYTPTKTKKERNITIPKGVEQDLLHLKNINGDGYLFSEDGGKTPISRKRVSFGLEKALCAIGVDVKAQKKRHITMHGWLL